MQVLQHIALHGAKGDVPDDVSKTWKPSSWKLPERRVGGSEKVCNPSRNHSKRFRKQSKDLSLVSVEGADDVKAFSPRYSPRSEEESLPIKRYDLLEDTKYVLLHIFHKVTSFVSN